MAWTYGAQFQVRDPDEQDENGLTYGEQVPVAFGDYSKATYGERFDVHDLDPIQGAEPGLRQRLLSSVDLASEPASEFQPGDRRWAESRFEEDQERPKVYINHQKFQDAGASGYEGKMLLAESLHNLKNVDPARYRRLQRAAAESPEYMKWAKESYRLSQDEGEERSFEDWHRVSRFDQVIGGYLFAQDPSIPTMAEWSRTDLPFGEGLTKELDDLEKALGAEQPKQSQSFIIRRPSPEEAAELRERYETKPWERITSEAAGGGILGLPSKQEIMERKYPRAKEKMQAIEDASWEGVEETGWGEGFSKTMEKQLPNYRRQVFGGMRGGNPVTVADLEQNAMAEQMITGTGRIQDSIENNRIAKEWGFEEGSDRVPEGVHPVDAFVEWLGTADGRGETELVAASTPVAVIAQDIWDAETQTWDDAALLVKPHSLKYYAFGSLDAFLNMGPAVAATFLTKNPMVGAAIMGTQVYGQTYGTMLDRGYSPDQARAAAVFSALAETVTERVSLGVLTKNNFTGLKRIFAGAGAEGLQEPITEALQMGYDVGILGDDIGMGEAFMRLVDAGIIGFGVGGGMGATVEALNRASTPAAQEEAKYEQHMDALHLDLTKANQEAQALEVLEGNTELLDKVINNQLADVSNEELAELEEQKLIRIEDDGTIKALPKARRQVAKAQVEVRQKRKKEALKARGVSEAEAGPTVEILDMAPAFAAAEVETEIDPTDAQKSAGNYRKGRFTWNGVEVAIETPAGATRSGVDEQGRPWSQVMNSGYGYFTSKPGADTVDGEPTEGVDAYIGPDLTVPTVYVINQAKNPRREAVGENFDEHKVMVGYQSQQAALNAYAEDFAPVRVVEGEVVGKYPGEPLADNEMVDLWFDDLARMTERATDLETRAEPLNSVEELELEELREDIETRRTDIAGEGYDPAALLAAPKVSVLPMQPQQFKAWLDRPSHALPVSLDDRAGYDKLPVFATVEATDPTPERYPSRGKKVTGAPPGRRSFKDIDKLIEKTVAILEDSKLIPPEAWTWYEDSGRKIREITRNDPELMHSVVQILAATSQGAGVGANTTFMIKGAYAIAKGETKPETGMYPQTASANIETMAKLETQEITNQQPGIGSKVMSFYRNLYDATFNTNLYPDDVTIDRWMVRNLGYTAGDSVEGTQYDYARKIFQDATARYNARNGTNWLPRNAQAALWVHERSKASMSKTGKVTPVDAFAEHIEAVTARVTHEAVPSKTTEQGRQVDVLPREEKQELGRRQREALAENNTHVVMEALGVPLYNVATAIGGYEGMINPNEISNIVMVGGAELDRPRADVFSRIMQYIYTQDAVPWFRAERKAATSEKTGNFGRRYTQGINWDLQGPLNEDQETMLFDALRKALGPDAGFSMVGEDQLVIIDFKDEKGVTFSGLKPAEFIEKIDQIGENIGADLGVVNSHTFGAEGNYLTQDWETDPNGQRLEEAIQEYASTRGPPDLLERVRAWRESAQGITREFLKADTRPRAGAAAPISVARLDDRSATEDAVFQRFGSVDRTRDTTEELKFYDLTPVVENPELTDRLADSFGYTIEVFSFEADNFKLPRLGKKNYEEGTVYIYDPAAAHGSFKDETYTRAWRVSHEIAHGITERLMQERYGDSRRYGRLGRPMMGERGVPPKRVEVELEPLTLLQAQRAVEWEDVAFRVQRVLLDKMGISIPDSVFNQEYNTNIADATFRTVTGDFADAGEFGFKPSVFKPTIKSILTGLERTEQALAEDQGREATEGIDLATYNQISDEQLQEAIDLQSREPADKPLFSVVPGVPADTKWYRGSQHEEIRLHRETGIVHASTSEKTASAFGPVSEVTLHVQNPFDYENPAHAKALKAQFRTNAQLMKFAQALDVVHGGERTWLGGEGTLEDVREYFNVGLEMGNYQTLESPAVLEAIRAMGHDSVYMVEDDFGPKGIAVFDAALMTRDAPLFAVIEDEVFPGFYSGLARAARNLKQDKGTGKQMLAMLTKMPGVKAEELDWTGVPEYLRAKETVTKDQLIAFIDANGVRIEETNLGYRGIGRGDMPEDVNWKKVQDAYEAGEAGGIMDLPATQQDIGGTTLTEEQIEVIEDRGSEYVTWESMTPGQKNQFAQIVYKVDTTGAAVLGTEYGGDSVTLPGGKNYREILLRLPEKSIDIPDVSRAVGWPTDATIRDLDRQMREKFNEGLTLEQRDFLQGGAPAQIIDMLDDWDARLGIDVTMARSQVAPPPVSMTVLQLEEGPATEDLADVLMTELHETDIPVEKWGWYSEEGRFEFENLDADEYDIVYELSRANGVQLISGAPEGAVPRAGRVNGVIQLGPGISQNVWNQINKQLYEIGLSDQDVTWEDDERRFYLNDVSPTMLDRANTMVGNYGLAALQQPSATTPVKRAPAGRRPIETYYAAHWSSWANILASIRITERIGEDGERIMFIEEIQSDWHQTGRDVGYRDRPRGMTPERDDLKAIKKPLTDTADYWEIRTKIGQFVVNVTAVDGVLPDESAAIDEGYRRLTQETEIRRRIEREERGAVPDAPFKGNAWAELAIKRVMRLAAEEGFDSVAWTTGEQQSARYSLSRVLNSLSVSPSALEGRPDVRIVWLDPHMGDSIQLQVNADGMIEDSGRHEFKNKKLSDVVGTPMAKQIMETDKRIEIDAENLDIGGQGMKSFYDRTIRNLVSKVIKKLDNTIKTSSTRIDTSEGRGGPYTVGRWPGSPPPGTPVAQVVEVQHAQLADLAAAARPIDEADYGSDRQINAQNNFTYTLQQILPSEQWENFEDYAHRATPEEMISYGMSLAAADAPPVIITHAEMGTLTAMAEEARREAEQGADVGPYPTADEVFFTELYEYISEDQKGVLDDIASDPDTDPGDVIDTGLGMVVGQSPDVEVPVAPRETVVSEDELRELRELGRAARPAEAADEGTPEQQDAWNTFVRKLSDTLPSYAWETWEERDAEEAPGVYELITYGIALAEEEAFTITPEMVARLENTAQNAKRINNEEPDSQRARNSMEAFSAELNDLLPSLSWQRWLEREPRGVDDDIDSGLRMARMFAGMPDVAVAAPVRVVGDQWGIQNTQGEWTGPYESEEAAIEGAARRDLEDLEAVHLVDISDQMRERLITDGLSLFAVTRQPAAGVPVANLQSVISEILDLYPGSPNVKIAATEGHMPNKQLLEIKHAGMEGKVGGMFDPETGDVYLIASNLKNMKQAVEIYLHETVGHYGVRSILGAEYDTIMDQVWKSHKEKVRAAARRNGLDVRIPSQRRIAAEEFIAYRAQRVLAGEKIPAREASLLKRLVEAIRIAIARLRGVQMSDADIQRLIRKARMFVATPANKSPGLLPARKAPVMFANLWKAINNDRVPNSGSAAMYRKELNAQVRAGNITEEDAEPLVFYLAEAAHIDKGGLLNQIRELGNRNAFHVDEYEGRANAIETGDLHESFTMDEGSLTSRRWNYLVFKAQDKFIDLLNVQKAIELQTGRPIDESLDAYLAEELFHGQVKSRVDRFEKDYIRPLTEAIDDSEYTWDEVEWFLYARHAPEANRRLYRINRSAVLRRARNKAKQKAEAKLEKRIARIDANKATQRNKIEAEHAKRLAVIESEYRSQMRRSKESQKKRREKIETAKANKIKRADASKNQRIDKLETKYKYVRADYELTYQAEIEEADVSFREREQERVKEDPGLLALSGMSNADAAWAMEALGEKGDISELEAIAAQVDAMTARNREIMVNEGLEEQSTIDAWEKAYQFYVPLKGFKDGPMNTTFFPKKGKGYDTGGKLNQRRLGRRSMAANILANIVAQHQSAVVVAEKSKVGRTLLEMVKKHPNPDLWTANEIETKKRLDPKTGLVITAVDPTYKLRDNVLRVKVDGKDYHITFNEESDVAMRIAKSMKNLSSDEINWLFRSMLSLNRILSAVNTSYNPEFIVSNLARDLQTAMINLNATDAQNMKMTILKDVFKAHRGIRRFLELPSFKDPESADYWKQQFEEYRDLGGQVGWLDNYKDVQDLETSLYRDMQDKTAGTLSWATLRKMGKFIEAENQAVENAVRLSAFVHAKTAGLSPRRAASLSKNLTVNFNRKGDIGTQLNAVYLFYNASIQGMAVIWNAAKSPKVRKIMYGIVAFAAGLEILNRMLAGDDDDGENRYDKIPAWVKERNMIIMIPERFRSQSPDDFTEHYITIPLPYGYNMLHTIGQKIGGIIDYTGIGNKREWSPLQDSFEILAAALGSFNPIGTGPTPLQTISPTVLTPFVQVSENVAWHGGPVMPSGNKYDPAPEPESQQYYRSVPKHAIALAEFLNKLGGGTKARPAPISPLDISPETIQLVEDFLTGGAGRFVTNMVELGVMAKEREVDMRKVPFARRFVGVTDERAVSNRYYENRTRIEYAIQEIKVAEEEIKVSGTQAEREDAIKNRARILEQYRPDAAMKEALRLVQKGLRDLNATRKAVRQSTRDEDWKKEREEQIELQKTKLMNKFNKRYNQILEKRRQTKEETAMNPQLPGKQRLAAVQQFNKAGYPATARLVGSLPVNPGTDFVERLNA